MWLQRKRGNCVQVKTEKSAQDLITNSNIVKTTSVGICLVCSKSSAQTLQPQA